MKRTIQPVLLSLLLFCCSEVMAQGFLPPADGKAMVYFVSLKKKSGTFEFFLNDRYIGILGKNNYKTVECEAGKNMLWASSESKYFVPSELSAGGTYIIVVETTSGFWRVNPKLVPITDDHPDFQAAVTLVKSKPQMVTPQNKIDKMNEDMKKFIPDELNYYETKLKHEKQFPSITPDMAIPPDKLK